MSNLYLWNSQGSSALATQSITASGSVNAFNTLALVDCSSSNITITLPVANASTKGQTCVIKKIDSSSNLVIIQPNGTDTIDSQNQKVYLFNQGDNITFCNNNGDNKILSDNRNSVGASMNYMRGSRTTTQTTSLNVGSPVIYTSIDNSLGSGISLNTTTGIITLKAGSTYNLMGSAGEVRFSSSGNARFQWYNITTSSYIGNGFGGDGSPTTTISTEIANATITPNVDTQIALYLTGSSNLSAYGYGTSLPWFYIEQVSKQATVLNTVDYVYGTVNSTTVSTTGVIISLSSVCGNINVTSNIINLLAGKTYQINISCRISSAGASIAINPYLYNLTTSTTLVNGSLASSTWNVNDDMANGCLLYTITPSVNTQLQLRGSIVGTGTPIISGNFNITQIGSTAYPMNQLGITGEVKTYAGSTAPDGWLLAQGQAVSRTTYVNLFNVIGTTYGSGDLSTTFNLPNLCGRSVIGTGQLTWSTTFSYTAVTVASDTITISTNDSLNTGTAVVLSTTGTVPTGLTAGTTYYVIELSSTSIKLATTLANAVAGTAIDITGQGTGNHTLTVTYTNRNLGAVGGEESHSNILAEIPSHYHNIHYRATDTGSLAGAGHPYTIYNGSNSSQWYTNSDGGGGGIYEDAVGGSSNHNNMQPYIALSYIIKY